MRNVVLSALVALSIIGAVPADTAGAQGAPCPMQTPDRWEYVDFAGVWERHGMALDVNPRGCGEILWRTYRACPPDRPEDCDRLVDGVLRYGGHAVFVLDIHEGVVASGRIVESSDWADLGNGGIVLHLKEDGTLTAEWDDTLTTFCRPWLHDLARCGS